MNKYHQVSNVTSIKTEKLLPDLKDTQSTMGQRDE